MLNFLSSFQTFLDHGIAQAKRSFGRKSVELADLLKAIDNERAINFEFGLCESLRNMGQHSLLPMGGMETVQSINKPNTDSTAESSATSRDGRQYFKQVRITVSVEQIVNSLRKGSPERKALQGGPTDIEVLRFIDSAMNSVDRIAKKINSNYEEKSKTASKYLIELLEEITKDRKRCFPFLITKLDKEAGPRSRSLQSSMVHFPLIHIALIKGGEDELIRLGLLTMKIDPNSTG